MGVKERPETGIPLLPLEKAGVFRSFVKGISDFDAKQEAARGLSAPARSFYSVYSIAKEERQTMVEVNKLADAESNGVYSKQAEFYGASFEALAYQAKR